MFYRGLISSVAALALALSATAATFAMGSNNVFPTDKNQKNVQVSEPLNLAVLVQDDLISQVGNELGVTREFIRSLPSGSRVMVGYITTGTLQVRQPFTSDLDKAARSLRVPRSSTSASAYNPYVEVIEALRSFNADWKGRKAILLISDGLDTSRGFDITSSGHTIDLERAIKQANDRDVVVYAFYAPAVGLTSRSRLAASYGQNSLNRLANDTGGQAFFQGTTGFVTFDAYFQRLRRALNEAA
jgi:VWFA-related protein